MPAPYSGDKDHFLVRFGCTVVEDRKRVNRAVQTPVVHKGEPAAKRKKWLSPFGFPDGSTSEESACNAGDAGKAGLIPGSRRSPGVATDNPLQSSRLGNPMDRGAGWATVHGVAKSQTTEYTCACTHTHTHTHTHLICRQ